MQVINIESKKVVIGIIILLKGHTRLPTCRFPCICGTAQLAELQGLGWCRRGSRRPSISSSTTSRGNLMAWLRRSRLPSFSWWVTANYSHLLAGGYCICRGRNQPHIVDIGHMIKFYSSGWLCISACALFSITVCCAHRLKIEGVYHVVLPLHERDRRRNTLTVGG